MCLSDKLDVQVRVIDALAELQAVSRVMHCVGVTWKPATSTGPQYPEWGEHARFSRTILDIAQQQHMKQRELDEGDARNCPATLAEVALARANEVADV